MKPKIKMTSLAFLIIVLGLHFPFTAKGQKVEYRMKKGDVLRYQIEERSSSLYIDSKFTDIEFEVLAKEQNGYYMSLNIIDYRETIKVDQIENFMRSSRDAVPKDFLNLRIGEPIRFRMNSNGDIIEFSNSREIAEKEMKFLIERIPEYMADISSDNFDSKLLEDYYANFIGLIFRNLLSCGDGGGN